VEAHRPSRRAGELSLLDESIDIPFLNEVEKESASFKGIRFDGVAFVAEGDKTAFPIYITFFDEVGGAFETEGLTRLVEKFLGHRYLTFIGTSVTVTIKILFRLFSG